MTEKEINAAIVLTKDYFHWENNRGTALDKVKHRIVKRVAREILQNNEKTTIGGKVYPFVLKSIGLGIYEISLGTCGEDTNLIK